MGQLVIDGHTKTDVDDRALAHLQFVIGNKVRRGEPFYFTWREDRSTGDGRTSVWLHPGVTLKFRFYGSRTPGLNREWLEARLHRELRERVASRPRACSRSGDRYSERGL